MSTARKFELASDEVYIQEALKDGRATIQEVSMKALGRPDVAFQARVNHIDMDHVHRLSLIHDQEGRLSPIVVFHAVEREKQRWITADGFHRHEVYRRKGERAIRAYVVEVTMDSIEHEARLFAAMCNQVTLLARTPQDVRRAAEMLFADPECSTWATQRIADFIGSGTHTVSKYRSEWFIRTGNTPPSKVFKRDGKEVPFRNARTTGTPAIHDRAAHDPRYRSQFKAKVGRKSIGGRTPEVVESKIADLTAERNKRVYSLETRCIQNVLIRRGFIVDWVSFRFGGFAFGSIATPDALMVSMVESGLDAVLKAVGLLIGLSDPAIPSRRNVVLCYPQDHSAALLDHFRTRGIEFLTPDELVESLKGAEGS